MTEPTSYPPQGKLADRPLSSDNVTDKADQIRDLIYDYIDVTPFERIIIEDPYFQRLRFIFQNSSAYLTYPSNQLTRFSHSLGVMHIGGQMFTHGLNNTNKRVRDSFFQKNKAALETRIKSYDLGESYETLKAAWTVSKTSNYAKLNFDIENEEFFVYHVYWQALRIACLCHDIGHLPFSHIFEMAIDEFNIRTNHEFKIGDKLIDNCINKIQDIFKATIRRNVKATDLHELIGAYLLCSIFDTKKDKNNTETKLLKLCLGLAIEMFLHGKRDYSSNDTDKDLFNCYYALISSDLDADRLDYILRDAKSSGLNLGNFDYTRILNHLELVETRKNDAFLIVPSEKSISSIDQFFNYRYLMYEYVYYHHNVAKYDGILIEILNKIFIEITKKDNQALKNLCINKFRLIDENYNLFPLVRKNQSIAYEYYDDCWLRNFLHELFQSDGLLDQQTMDLLETFLFRAKNNAVSWSKNSVQIDNHLSNADLQDLVNNDKNFRLMYFLENGNSLGEDLNKEIQKWRPTLEDLKPEMQLETLKSLIKQIDEAIVPPLQLKSNTTTRRKFRIYLNEASITKVFIAEQIATLRTSLCGNGVTLIMKNVPPKLLSADPKEAQKILVKGSGLKFLTEASFYLENLKNLSITHFKFYFAFAQKNLNDKSDNSGQTLNKCTQEVSKFLFAIMSQGLLLKVRDKIIIK